MKSNDSPQTRQHNIVIQEFDNEVLIYDLSKNKAFCLNETSTMIWQECDGIKPVAEISRIVSKKVKSNVSEDFVWLALQQFKKDELLEDSREFKTPLDGLSRREVIKRVGFASLIALPIVASVIAPTAVCAQSGGCGCGANNNQMNQSNPGCVCTSSLDCCSGLCAASGGICGAMAANPPGSPACCPTVVCPPQNAIGIPPGCGCNPPNGGVCASGNCIGNVCSI